MRFKDVARQYQYFALEHMKSNPYCALFMEMGLGKTACTLLYIDWLTNFNFEIQKTIIIAPYNVADTVWSDERDKWDEFSRLRISKIMGTEKERLAAIKKEADIYIINVENVSWLVTVLASLWPFQLTIIDELSCFKSSDSQRFRSLSMVRPLMDRVVGLTGTPAPNGLHDLWSQMYLIDEGKRLFPNFTQFQREYLAIDKVGQWGVIKWGITESNADRIYKKIGDICVSMKEKDYIKLPPLMFQDHKFSLPEKVRHKYEEFEKTLVLDYVEEHGKEIIASNSAVLTGKLLQFASGAVYDAEKNYTVVHNYKLNAVAEIIEAANGEPVLIAYQHRHDYERMMKKFGGHLFKKGDTTAWNNKEYPIMYIHPKSGGHGLNLQAGGCILVWFSMTWSLEQWLQLNKRLHRSGQTRPVVVHRIIAKGTMDVKAAHSLELNERGQTAMMNATKALIKKHTI